MVLREDGNAIDEIYYHPKCHDLPIWQVAFLMSKTKLVSQLLTDSVTDFFGVVRV